MKIKVIKHQFSVNALVLSYCLLGCVGGAGLGLVSLGLPGLILGLTGGAFLAYVLHTATVQMIK